MRVWVTWAHVRKTMGGAGDAAPQGRGGEESEARKCGKTIP